MIVPLCALTTAETIARPSPVLPPLLEREESPRANRSNTSDCSSAGMPGPLSMTCSTLCAGSVVNRVVTTVPARGVDAGVGKQIGHHLVQPCRITGDDHGLFGQVELPLVIRSRDVGVTDRVDRQPRQVHRFAFQRAAGVQASEQQQVLDQARHPRGLGRDPTHRLRHRLAVIAHPLGEFGVAADRGKRRAQFVTRVGDELTNPGLAGLPRRQRGRDVVEHPVQRRSELAHLGVGVRVSFGHPHRQFDLAARQRQVRDPARGLRDAAQAAPAHAE